MQFKEKENVWCCLLDCGVRCLPGTSDNRPQKVVSSMSLMTNIQELNNSVEEGVMPFTVCNPWGCHGCELQSFHSIAKYLQRTISCFKNDKSLTWRVNILVLVNYLEGLPCVKIYTSTHYSNLLVLAKPAQTRKFKSNQNCLSSEL